MKFKIKFRRNYSIMISIMACAMGIWMMVRNFGYPVEKVINIAWVSVLLLVTIIIIAAVVALASRWLADKREEQ